MTTAQSLAFVDALVSSPKVKAHLAAILGHKLVASAEDFEQSNAEACDRAEELIRYLEEVAGCLEAVHGARPRQKEASFEGTEVEASGGEVRVKRRRYDRGVLGLPGVQGS